MGSGGGSGLDFGETRGRKLDAKARKRHSKALPNARVARINEKKVKEYMLNPSHPDGKNKAKVFESALGFTQSDSKLLMKRIREELPYNEAKLIGDRGFGKLYRVDMPITGPNGQTKMIRTGWIIETGVIAPHLTTAYVL